MLSLLLQIPAFAPTGQVDFIKLILEQILRISPTLISQYPLVQDKLLWLVLVPHVIVFLFLFAFGTWIVPRHTGLRRILAITTYLVLILAGWYGSFVVPLVNAWFTILLVTGFLFFLISRIFPPTSLQAATGILGEAIGHAASGTKKRKQLEKDVAVLNKTIADLRQQAHNARPGEAERVEEKIADLQHKLREKEHELEEAGG